MTKLDIQALLLHASTGILEASPSAPTEGITLPAALAKLRSLFAPAVPTEVFVTYWRFAVERQRIFFRRFAGQAAPWTTDAVLSAHRFTNAYRAADRVSQYLIRNVQYDRNWVGEDLFFRTILFKFFNRIETWERLVKAFGEPQWKTFSPEKYSLVLDKAMSQGNRIYSAAYIMPSGGPNSKFRRKHDLHLHLLQRMMKECLPAKLEKAKSMGDAFVLLRAYPTIGNFLAYQYATDLNYSELTDFNENEFVVAGPGAIEGIGKCFSNLGGKDLAWFIHRVADVQADVFKSFHLPFGNLWGRPLKYIDCQNLFCEVAKYARIRHPEFNRSTGRTRIKQKFVPDLSPMSYAFPPKWAITVSPNISVDYVESL